MTTPLHVRSVALLHRPPDAPAHVDWMWAPRPDHVGDDERVLTTLRLPRAPLEMAGPFVALRLPDHRGRYLWFEGDLGRGLGTVERVWEGIATLIAQCDESFSIELERRRFDGSAIGSDPEGTRYRVNTSGGGAG